MCTNPNKTKEEVHEFLTKTLPTLSEEDVKKAATEWSFAFIGGNHTGEVARRLGLENSSWLKIQGAVVINIPDIFRRIIRGVIIQITY